MDDQPTALAGAAVGTAAVENQVLSSPLYGLDSLACEAFRELGRQGVAQLGGAKNGLNNGLPRQMRQEAQTGDFDFGEFRHLPRTVKVHNMSRLL